MGYEVFRADEVEYRPPKSGDLRRSLAPLSHALSAMRANLWRLPPGTKGRRHIEHAQEELLVILTGTPAMLVGEPPERVGLSAGDIAVIGTEAARQLINDGPAEAVVLIIGAPPEQGKAELLPDADVGPGLLLQPSGDSRRESAGVTLRPIGRVRSSFIDRRDAPRQGFDGGVDAWLEIEPFFVQGLDDLAAGMEIIVLTWLHLSERDVLKVHPRGDPQLPLKGVFATRAPVRPNPLGLHRVRILEIDGGRLRVTPLEVVDGTPIVDIKPALNDPRGQ